VIAQIVILTAVVLSAIVVVLLVMAFILQRQTGFEGKTLWDWMGLLIVPLILGVGVFLLDTLEKRRQAETDRRRADHDRQLAEQRATSEREIAKDNQRQVTLEAYFDRMTALLLANNLRESSDGDEVRSIARTRTLTVLRELDGKRRGQVLQFLYELNLINGDKPIVDMRFADLRELDLPYAHLENISLPEANLRKSNLHSAKLCGANFNLADLDEIVLDWADLRNANLHCGLSKAEIRAARLDGAILAGANLHGASLINSSLVGADLRYANLKYKNEYLGEGADNIDRANLGLAKMSQCNLSGAKIDPAQLAGVQSLAGAIMPNGMLFEKWREQLMATGDGKCLTHLTMNAEKRYLRYNNQKYL
jgi:uncharacterized protein YjbI with pentapeptide repeats